MGKVIRLTESDLVRLVKRIVKEDTESVTQLNSINQELSSAGIPSVSMEDLERGEIPPQWNELNQSLQSAQVDENYDVDGLYEKLRLAICKATPDELKTAKTQILNLIRKFKSGVGNTIRSAFGKKETPVNEQVGGVITILGITGPFGVMMVISCALFILILMKIMGVKFSDKGGRGTGCPTTTHRYRSRGGRRGFR